MHYGKKFILISRLPEHELTAIRIVRDIFGCFEMPDATSVRFCTINGTWNIERISILPVAFKTSDCYQIGFLWNKDNSISVRYFFKLTAEQLDENIGRYTDLRTNFPALTF